MPSLLHNDPFTHPSHCRGCHEPSAETVATIVLRIYLNHCERAFDCPCHAEATQCASSDVAPAIHWPKDWPAGDTRKLQPSLQGAFWTGRITCSDRDAFGEAGALLISLGAPQGDNQASIADLNAADLSTHAVEMRRQTRLAS